MSFAELEAKVRWEDAAKKAGRLLSRQVGALVLQVDARSVFFTTLLMRLRRVASTDVPTMAVDGKRLFYNPDFVLSLSQPELVGVLCHEVMHLALSHHARRGHRDPHNFNLAADLACNPLLLSAGFQLPGGRLVPGEGPYAHLPPGLSAEEYYNLLPPRKDRGEGEGGGKGKDPGGCGGVTDAESPEESEAEWKQQVAAAAAVARRAGKLPGDLDRAVGEVVSPKLDWRQILRRFVSSFARNDFSWSVPNYRMLHRGLYLPGMRSEELGEVLLMVDTSGSIGAEQLSAFAAEAQAILSSYDCSLRVWYHDTDVLKEQTWQSSDGDLALEPVGGGGTSHVPAFARIDTLADPPVCVVCLTDLYTCFPEAPCPVPTLWAVSGNPSGVAPWGETVHL